MSLLVSKRFFPLLGTIFLGAFNDNLLKNGLIFLVTYQSVNVLGMDPKSVIAVASGLLVLPFFLFSALAGQFADKFEKSRCIQFVKLFEIFIMLLACAGFLFERYDLLLLLIFLMGLQSTFYGPLKYGILPQLLSSKELVLGNAIAQAFTFLAILLGTLGGVVVRLSDFGFKVFVAALIVVALKGWVMSFFIPKVKAGSPEIRISWNFFSTSWQMLRFAAREPSVFWSILGNSWFWFLGAMILSLLPILAKDLLRVDELVLTCFLLSFTLGIGLGSVLCGKFSKRRLELGLVPFGSIGICISLFMLSWIGEPDYIKNLASGELANLRQFFGSADGWSVLLNLIVLAIFSGFYTVPLQTLIQERSPDSIRSRVIAANNLINAIFLVASSVALLALYELGLSIPQIILVLAFATLAVSLLIFDLVPEFLLRFLVYILSNILYRVRLEGEEHIPASGAAVLVCNHVSFVDWLFIGGAIPRPIRFVMTRHFFKGFFVKKILTRAKVIPIASRADNLEMYEKAFERVREELREGELVLIFPEGKLSVDGEIAPFKKGVEKILSETPVPVIPLALKGVWGSYFSLEGGRSVWRWPKKLFGRIELVASAPIPPEKATAEILEETVRRLRGTSK